jgi:hypothetical protein
LGSNATNLSSAELYDPATGEFSRTGSLPYAFVSGVAVRLGDGSVFFVDGQGSETYLYNPKSGRFTTTGPSLLNLDGGYPTATLLPSGGVFVTGMADLGTGVTTQAEAYDLVSGKFKLVAMPAPAQTSTSPACTDEVAFCAMPQTATLLPNGKVLLDEFGTLQSYDPASGAFASAGAISPNGVWAVGTATLMADGNVLFAGGQFVVSGGAAGNYQTVASATVYDPSEGPHAVGPMNAARNGATATLLSDGHVLMAGGDDDHGNPGSSAELFLP